MYCCGPTVHDFAHIGNFRTFVFVDLFRRYLEWKRYDVEHVMNITDVEDKIIRKIGESGESLSDYTSRYEKAFFDDLKALGCLSPHQRPRATEHIDSIIRLIEKLIANGFAYVSGEGSVFFSISKYQASGRCYGQLLNLNFEAMRPGERVAADEYEKDAVADFALWKAKVDGDGGVSWKSPWGEGRPGWHIECSAMSMDLLGESFDVHLGGEDLVFPHHEDEIAQSEGACLHASDQRFVKYWVHGAHLLVEGKKMSKSLGNYFTLRDLQTKGFKGREIRYSLLSAHYRDTYNFTLDGLTAAKTALARLDDCLSRLQEVADGAEAAFEPGLFEERFAEALDDDFNVSAMWASVFDWVRDQNRRLSEGDLRAELAAAELGRWKALDQVLGVGPGLGEKAAIPAAIDALLQERQAARKSKDFARADQLRDELMAAGWVIEDTPKGPRLKRVSDG